MRVVAGAALLEGTAVLPLLLVPLEAHHGVLERAREVRRVLLGLVPLERDADLAGEVPQRPLKPG
jgi:hypothetical protein